tara:strand:+ start:5837 stop:6442 length:606 start_codon:yes stop_codon:yes gene_type:complete
MKLKTLFLLSSLLLSACSITGPPSNTLDVCEIFQEKKSWYKAANRSEERWGVPVSVSMAFIKQESSFIAAAKPPRVKVLRFIPWKRQSSAKGYSQAIDGTWEMYLNERGKWLKSRNNFDDAVDFIGWYNAKSIKKFNIKNTNAKDLYLAYHEGWAGYTRKSYRKKPWLIKVAVKVQKQSNVYNGQYKECKQKLGKKVFKLF